MAFFCPYVSAIWSHLLSIFQEFFKMCLRIGPVLVPQCRDGFLTSSSFYPLISFNPHNDSVKEVFIITFQEEQWGSEKLTVLELGPWFIWLPVEVQVFSLLVRDFKFVCEFPLPVVWELLEGQGGPRALFVSLAASYTTQRTQRVFSHWQLTQGHMTKKVADQHSRSLAPETAP